MADLANLNSYRPDHVQVFIDGDVAPHFASVEYSIRVTTHDIKPASVGVVLERMVVGCEISGTIVFEQTTEAELRKFLATQAAGDDQHHVPAIGSFLPKHAIRLHSPFSETGASDVNIEGATIGNIRQSMDGEGVAQVSIDFAGIYVGGVVASVKSPA